MGKIDSKKQQKRETLLDSAFSLFIDHGFSKTSISEIVNHAGVAKGTFYLYFKDKYDIRNHLIAHKASQVFQAAYTELKNHTEITDFEDQVLFIIDHILGQFVENPNLVLLLSKHLSWGLFKNTLLFSPGRDTPPVLEIFKDMLDSSPYEYETPEIMMYTILEITGGFSYNAILFEQPAPLAEIKPHLYKTIRLILTQYRISEADSKNKK